LGDGPDRFPKARPLPRPGNVLDSPETQNRLFHRRVSTRLPGGAQGQHLSFTCIADDGNYFYCKDDRDGHPVRASDWLATRLAREVGIATAPCSIVEDAQTGEKFFGSMRLPSIADRFAVADFLSRTHPNEIGQIGTWPGQYLSMLFTFDQFIDNPDRGHDNFVLVRDGLQTNLCAIDFASARIFRCTIDGFPVETERTIFVGKRDQTIHGAHMESALEMLNRLARVPADLIRSILDEMPEAWLSETARGMFDDFWSNGLREQRLKNLHAALTG
jgi:hypothetical protein